MNLKSKLNLILLFLIILHLYACNKKNNTVKNISIPRENTINKKKIFLQDSTLYNRNPYLLNFITSDYDRNGIKDTVYLLAKDSIVEFSILLNGKIKIKNLKLLIPMSDYDSERMHNFFLFGNDSDTISLRQEYGATRDGMSYIIYYDRHNKKFIARYIIYNFQNNKSDEMIEDTIFKNKSIEQVDMYKYFKLD
ncbi:hypothetical protein [Flavobacterium branchiicola]|uniref:Lipoprotein n=1 Tax=Flavobacterium branchiicola TaxID=1114875 RepID=A0ABV9P925_9FLAO|nr:hypothetical protein [Flavobacterium branchiicola]MBS7253709.1 hypothetical protein [Flavobacterium branchiicola]